MEMRDSDVVKIGTTVETSSGNLRSYTNRVKNAIDSVKVAYIDDTSSKYYDAVDNSYEASKKVIDHVESTGRYMTSVAKAVKDVGNRNTNQVSE